jgi:hypothetical protein
MKKQEQNMVGEPSPDYEKAETDLLRDALKRSYEERFHMMTNLMKRSLMFRNAVITHKPLPSSE